MISTKFKRAVLLAGLALGLAACGPKEPQTAGTPLGIRRLSEEQYRNVVADVFGTGIVVSGRFDPMIRTDGLRAVGAWNTSITPQGLVQYEEMARNIAAQVVSDANREVLIPCKPASAAAYDKVCAEQFFTKVGRLLYRRPMAAEEMTATLKITEAASDSLKNFYDGVGFGLARLLVSPDFLFVSDVAEADPKNAGTQRLNAFSKAARLSFFLWNSAPDDRLLQAAEKGDLYTAKGTEREVARMIASPRLKTGMRAFFSDMYGFDAFNVLEKDATIYPAFGQVAAQDAKEQTLRTITDLVLKQDGDYRDLFTTRKTYMTRPLGRVYEIRVTTPDGVWEPYEFPIESRRAGIQSQLSLLALNSHPGRSSPTLRGKAIRTYLLCQRVPDPPGDVDFSKFGDPDSPNKTARDRLTAHSTMPACAGCHKITDPIGLAMENFDGAGTFRTSEDGTPIDSSGDLDGVRYDDPVGLAKALHDSPAVAACVVNRLASYATGQPTAQSDKWVNFLREDFASNGYRVKNLLQRIATSDAFVAVPPPAAATSTKQASAQ